jgi:hypothetical protein
MLASPLSGTSSCTDATHTCRQGAVVQYNLKHPAFRKPPSVTGFPDCGTCILECCCCWKHVSGRRCCAACKLLHPQQPTAFPQHNRASVLSHSNLNPCALQRMPCHSGLSQLCDASTCSTAMTQAWAAQHQSNVCDHTCMALPTEQKSHTNC